MFQFSPVVAHFNSYFVIVSVVFTSTSFPVNLSMQYKPDQSYQAGESDLPIWNQGTNIHKY